MEKVGLVSKVSCQSRVKLKSNLGATVLRDKWVQETKGTAFSLGKFLSVPSSHCQPLSSLTFLENPPESALKPLAGLFCHCQSAPVPIWSTSMYLVTTGANTVDMTPYHSSYWLNRCRQLACSLGSCNSIPKVGQILRALPQHTALPTTTKRYSHCSFPSVCQQCETLNVSFSSLHLKSLAVTLLSLMVRKGSV